MEVAAGRWASRVERTSAKPAEESSSVHKTSSAGFDCTKVRPGLGAGEADARADDDRGGVIARADVVGSTAAALNGVADDQIVGADDLNTALATGAMVAVNAIGSARSGDLGEDVAGAVVVLDAALAEGADAVAAVGPDGAAADEAAVVHRNAVGGVRIDRALLDGAAAGGFDADSRCSSRRSSPGRCRRSRR